MAHATVAGVAHQRSRRILVVLASALLATVAVGPSGALGAARTSDSAAPSTSATTPAATTQAKPRRAVIVVGPVGSQTAEYVGEARHIRDALVAGGITVELITPPNATWKRVKAAAEGANFFAYLGHGSGWPSPYVSNGEDTKDGLGLNPYAGDANTSDVKYYGANFLAGGYRCTLGVPPPTTEAACKQITYGVWKNYGTGIHFARNAIVLLNRLCYAAGDGEDGMPVPSKSVAVQRVDNMAAGYLKAGARTVFALAWQPGVDIAKWLVSKHATMNQLFQMRDGKSSSPDYLPFHGWVGPWSVYVHSKRTADTRIHLDPQLAANYKNGYLRAVTGGLKMTTDQWWGR
jgi:hypothetical protein